MAARRTGVYLVKIGGSGTVDHAVVVEADGEAIVDSEETQALVLSPTVLEICGYLLAPYLRICVVQGVERC